MENSSAHIRHRLGSLYRLLRIAIHLFTAEPGDIDDVRLIEDLVFVVDHARLYQRRCARQVQAVPRCPLSGND